MENKTNYKEIFNITNKLLNRNTDLPLPPPMTTNYWPMNSTHSSVKKLTK